MAQVFSFSILKLIFLWVVSLLLKHFHEERTNNTAVEGVLHFSRPQCQRCGQHARRLNMTLTFSGMRRVSSRVVPFFLSIPPCDLLPPPPFFLTTTQAAASAGHLCQEQEPQQNASQPPQAQERVVFSVGDVSNDSDVVLTTNLCSSIGLKIFCSHINTPVYGWSTVDFYLRLFSSELRTWTVEGRNAAFQSASLTGGAG